MSISTVNGFDITAENYTRRPSNGQIALYVTGSSQIIATLTMLANNPHAVKIAQSPVITTDQNAMPPPDIFDVETGAITIAILPELISHARATYNAGTHQGQRWPGVYVNQSNITSVVNVLKAANLSGVPIWLADYNYTLSDAVKVIQTASGPYPIVAVQYSDSPVYYDVDVFSESWLNTVSTAPDPTPAPIKVIITWQGADGLVSRKTEIPVTVWNTLVKTSAD